jgi:hypothetical protein
VRAARLASRWLWLPGALNPPADCRLPKTPVPHTAAAITAAAPIARISQRLR